MSRSRPARPPAAANAAGFSLLETIVAFTVAAMTMAVMMELLSHDVEGTGTTADFARAVQIAESRLDSLGVSAPLVPGTTAGWLDRRFRWQMVVTSEPAPRGGMQKRPPVQPCRVRITVSWPAGSTAKSVSLETVRLRPSS